MRTIKVIFLGVIIIRQNKINHKKVRGILDRKNNNQIDDGIL
jgi:hypothetical protein